MKTQTSRAHVKTIAVCSILAVIGFILDRFVGINIPLFGVTSLMINLSYVPIFLAGIIYGPVWGGLVGGVQDIMCMIIVPLGAPIWGITATTVLAGVLAGIFGKYILNRDSYDKDDCIQQDLKKGENNKILQMIFLIMLLVYFVVIFFPSLNISVNETVHSVSVWDILVSSSDYKNAFIEISSFYDTDLVSESFYFFRNLEKTFFVIGILFCTAYPLSMLSLFMCHEKKSVKSVICAVFGFVLSGLAVSSMVLQLPQLLKGLDIDIKFGIISEVYPVLCVMVIILVLIRADPLKFKILAFCTITSVITSVLNSFWISLAYTSVTFWVYLLPRLATALLISSPLYSILLYYLIVKASWLKKII